MLRHKPVAMILLLLALSLVAAACGGGAAPTATGCLEAEDGTLVDSPCEVPGVTPDPTPTSAPSGNGNGDTDPGLVVFRIGGCAGCHAIDGVSTGAVGPALNGVGAELGAELIRQSIVDPEAVIAEDCPSGACPAGVMPATFGSTLTAQQLDDLVDYLSGL